MCHHQPHTHALLWHTHFTHFKCQCWRILVQFCITAGIFSSGYPSKNFFLKVSFKCVIPNIKKYLKCSHLYSTSNFVPLQINEEVKMLILKKQTNKKIHDLWFWSIITSSITNFWHTEDYGHVRKVAHIYVTVKLNTYVNLCNCQQEMAFTNHFSSLKE